MASDKSEKVDTTVDDEGNVVERGSDPRSLATVSGPRDAAAGDPALFDPKTTAADRVKGRTSDAATRNEDVRVDDIPRDASATIPKLSDAGAEDYPFPPQGDVDVATVVEAADDDAHMAPLEIGDTVVLDGTHDLVPERLDGARAFVLDAPRILCNCDWAPTTHEHASPDAGITVRARDETGATLILPLAAFKTLNRGGVPVRG